MCPITQSYRAPAVTLSFTAYCYCFIIRGSGGITDSHCLIHTGPAILYGGDGTGTHGNRMIPFRLCSCTNGHIVFITGSRHSLRNGRCTTIYFLIAGSQGDAAFSLCLHIIPNGRAAFFQRFGANSCCHRIFAGGPVLIVIIRICGLHRVIMSLCLIHGFVQLININRICSRCTFSHIVNYGSFVIGIL